MTSMFNLPILRPAEHLDPLQKARGAALLVAAEARPASTAMDLLHLADYVFQGTFNYRRRDPHELFGNANTNADVAWEADPSTFGPLRRIPNFGDLYHTPDNENPEVDNPLGQPQRGQLTEEDGLDR